MTVNAVALLEAADDVQDMGRRVVVNGAEVFYASEKMAFALFKAAQVLALCGVELEGVLEQARKGYEHGEWLR